ncbi:glycosyltransferase [Neolewinella litorea]|uniref:Glycosyltransferase n=1 Tax=Neolewinella litorea TaxID=2562452 RepID=A0A4S4NYQ4_9BACT|nr:glycosyltransferase [Neolewinella litorea]THH41400.1 glycosyltransferase [Neolewinella litorea]
MLWLLLILLSACAVGVIHTYVLYPVAVQWAAARRCHVQPPPKTVERWPSVAVLMAVHNEARILPRKLRSLERQDYRGRLQFYFASDLSTDGSDELLRQFAAAQPAGSCQVVRNPRRLGKPATVNELYRQLPSEPEVLILTDASVILYPDTITELIRPMVEDARVGVTDARVRHTGTDSGDISDLEDRYIRGEVALKEAESCVFGRFIGPFGGCWGLRRELYTPVPPSFLVDDFFLCMGAYARGWRGVSSPRAGVEEGVGQRLRDEFRRKRRIGAGNWQNLVYFRRLWWPPFGSGLAFAFFSHKVLRWLTPLFLLTGLACVVGLGFLTGNYWGTLAFLLLLALLCTRVRALRYFMAMNAALLLGLIDYANGIRTNVWQPSHRSHEDGTR